MKYATSTITRKKGYLLLASILTCLAVGSLAYHSVRVGATPVEPPATTFSPETLSEADDDNSEIWVTSQGTHRLFILKDQGIVEEIVQLPAGAGPHITTFSPSNKFAYVSGMADGNLYILDADSRQIVQTLNFGPSILTHQAKPSPDGSILLVANVEPQTRRLYKVAVNEAAQSWTVAGSLSFLSEGKSPICTVFRDDGRRAYVSLLPSGVAIVDVPTMTLLGTLPTEGFVACGMIKSHNGSTVTIASSGSGGHIYRLDTATDALSDAGALGAPDWHSFNISPDEKIGYGSSPESDQLIMADLAQPMATNLGTLALDPTPGMGNDQPDAIAVRGDTVFVSLRASGKLAIVKANQRIVSYLDISPPAPFNPANCAGCAIHGVTARPSANKFDICLRDDDDGDTLAFNSLTGNYAFTRCGAGGFTLTGRGAVSRAGCLLKLNDARVNASLHRCPIAPSDTGAAIIRLTPLGPTFSIKGSNDANQPCACR